MANKLEIIDGDVQITGHLDVVQGINDTQISDVQAVAETSSSLAVRLDSNVDGILSDLDDLDSDSKLTPAEKLIVKREWTNIENEYANVKNQATNAKISTSATVYTDYTGAYDDLDDYLNNASTRCTSRTRTRRRRISPFISRPTYRSWKCGRSRLPPSPSWRSTLCTC